MADTFWEDMGKYMRGEGPDPRGPDQCLGTRRLESRAVIEPDFPLHELDKIRTAREIVSLGLTMEQIGPYLPPGNASGSKARRGAMLMLFEGLNSSQAARKVGCSPGLPSQVVRGTWSRMRRAMRGEEWNEFLDSLVRSGSIT